MIIFSLVFGWGLFIDAQYTMKMPVLMLGLEPKQFIRIIRFPIFPKLSPSFSKTSVAFTTFGNILGKEENAGNQRFLFFPQCFLSFQIHIPSFNPFFFYLSSSVNFDNYKILWSRKGLKVAKIFLTALNFRSIPSY